MPRSSPRRVAAATGGSLLPVSTFRLISALRCVLTEVNSGGRMDAGSVDASAAFVAALGQVAADRRIPDFGIVLQADVPPPTPARAPARDAGKGGGPRTVVLLCPAEDARRPPRIDSFAIGVTSAEEWIVAPSAWAAAGAEVA
jgi:hypothetical protein